MDSQNVLSMKEPRTYVIFLIGSMILMLITAIYYAVIPAHDYFGEGYTMYAPGETLPAHLSGKYVVSNLFLLKRLISLLVGYLVTFDVLYLLLWNFGKIEIPRLLVWAHTILVVFGSVLLVYLNPFVLAYVAEMPDLISVELLPIREANELQLWYNAVTSRTSILGMLMFLSGSVTFFVGTIRAWRERSFPVRQTGG